VGIQLVLNENAVRFDTNKSSLTTTAKANLDNKVVPVFAEYPDTDITILDIQIVQVQQIIT
jgi:outer membrane protein OmpA-like peptidoglycan-associated protein